MQQLQTIGKRLDTLETKNCKKTTDVKKIKGKSNTKKSQQQNIIETNAVGTQVFPEIGDAVKNQQSKHVPSLLELRQDPLIQDRVQQRIQELNQLVNSGDSKIKSQRGGVDVFVKNRVRWAHEYVLSGSNKERVSYDQLSVVQWVVSSHKIQQILKSGYAMADPGQINCLKI